MLGQSVSDPSTSDPQERGKGDERQADRRQEARRIASNHRKDTGVPTRQNETAPFVLTLTPEYVARASGKTPPISFDEIERYADENAGDLREIAFWEKGTGRLDLTLE